MKFFNEDNSKKNANILENLSQNYNQIKNNYLISFTDNKFGSI